VGDALCYQETVTEETVGEEVERKGCNAGDHGHFVLTLGGREGTAEAHPSTPLHELFVRNGSVLVNIKKRRVAILPDRTSSRARSRYRIPQEIVVTRLAVHSSALPANSYVDL